MEKIGKYSILGELGRGGQGTVYHALDVDTQRQVALKVIRVDPELPADDPELLTLVRDTEEQAKKLMEIEHRNVARVFEAGYQDGMIYIAREMIDGSFDKTYIWLRHPEFSNRILPPYIGLSDEETRICRELFEEHFKDIP